MRTLVIIVLSLLLQGCFHWQTAQRFPLELKALTLTADNVYGEITEDLARKLRAEKVDLTASCKKSRLILKLTDSKSNTTIPTVFNSLSATTYYYNLAVTVELIYQKGDRSITIFNTRRSANQSVTYNVNQVGAPVLTPLMRKALTRQLVNAIYYLLISNNTLNSIKQLEK